MNSKTLTFNKKDIDEFTTSGIIFETTSQPVSFSRSNLVIGENGSGKTRFLKCLEEICKKQYFKKTSSSICVVTLYFPEAINNISGIFTNNQEGSSEGHTGDPEFSLLDIIKGNQLIEFEDFIKVIEKTADKDEFSFGEQLNAWLNMSAKREHAKAESAFISLNQLLQDWVNRKIEYKEGRLFLVKYASGREIRSKPWNEAFSAKEMSPGEYILFYFCLFIYYIQNCHGDKKIFLIIDEPELHLHTKKLIKFVTAILAINQIEQIWMASHSVFLVPEFDFKGLILMDNNVVYNRSSKTYAAICEKIIGFQNNNIIDFINNLRSWEYYHFIAECFCLPSSIDKVDVSDVQFIQFVKSLENIQINRPLKILDFGAGKARIWDCLMQLYCDNKAALAGKLEYCAYEPYLQKGDTHAKDITIYKSKEELVSLMESSTRFDIIVLMNVLHEVPIVEWEKTLENISQLLNESGNLVFLEVDSLTKGEQPYGNNGYLLLNDEVVQKYFKPTNNEIFDSPKSNIWIIPKNNVALSHEIIVCCITDLMNSTKAILQKEYQLRMDYAHKKYDTKDFELSARKYAFYSQQYINAMFALNQLCTNTVSDISVEDETGQKLSHKDDRLEAEQRSSISNEKTTIDTLPNAVTSNKTIDAKRKVPAPRPKQ